MFPAVPRRLRRSGWLALFCALGAGWVMALAADRGSGLGYAPPLLAPSAWAFVKDVLSLAIWALFIGRAVHRARG